MRSLKLLYEPEAIQDIEDIVDFIGITCENPTGAKKVYLDIKQVIDELRTDYDLHPVSYLTPFYELGIHSFMVGKYRVLYQFDLGLGEVHVLRVVHGARDAYRIKVKQVYRC